MSKNPKNFKRPRLQSTRASDITQTHHFTHSSNTSTRTRQIMTSAEFVPSEPTTSTTSSPPGMEMPSNVDDFFLLPEEVDHPAGIEVLTKARRYVNSVWTILSFRSKVFLYKNENSQDSPLLTWTKYRGNYLDACLILEGRGRFYDSSACGNPKCCSEPGYSSPTFRCLDCFGNGLLCQECIVSLHHINPLHRIQVKDN